MRFTLIILASSAQHQAPASALRFAQALIESGQDIYRVFFYRDGVQVANALSASPADEMNINAEWNSFASTHQLDMVVCIASAIRRGVLDTTEAKRYGKTASNLHEHFQLSGLGQLIDASLHSDRVITFGSHG